MGETSDMHIDEEDVCAGLLDATLEELVIELLELDDFVFELLELEDFDLDLEELDFVLLELEELFWSIDGDSSFSSVLEQHDSSSSGSELAEFRISLDGASIEDEDSSELDVSTSPV